tara:strand:- start:13 stop:303 length:291 start_codon:yes stop_codon:yes gene_type:complete
MNRLTKFIKHFIIKHQHDAININFDILKNILIQHIDYENYLLDYQKKNISNTHIDINEKIKQHKQKHYEFLQKIINMEKELNEHLKVYDYIHLHRL